MEDNFTKQFFNWLDNSETSREEAAEQLGNTPSTLAKWKSIGIPKGKQYACKMLMERIEESTEEIPNRLQILASREEFNRWNRAALSEGLIIEDWAYYALRDAADAWEKNQLKNKANNNSEKAAS